MDDCTWVFSTTVLVAPERGVGFQQRVNFGGVSPSTACIRVRTFAANRADHRARQGDGGYSRGHLTCAEYARRRSSRWVPIPLPGHWTARA